MKEYSFRLIKDGKDIGKIVTVDAETYEEASEAIDEIIARDFPGCEADDA